MRIEALDYELPADRIATEPAQPRDAARLMIVDRNSGRVEHAHVCDLAGDRSPLRPSDLMVFNQTRVLPAHFTGRRAATGGQVTGLYLKSHDDDRCHWHVMLESRGKLRPGETIALADVAHLELVEALGGGQWRTTLHSRMPTFELLGHIGSPPLPPYIRKARRACGQSGHSAYDAERYNTVFAAEPGSVAAPTAALHFTHALLDAIKKLGVATVTLTLHIGLGTFAPIRAAHLHEHEMHREWISIPAATIAALQQTRQAAGRIIPVGTTCVRALESLPNPLPYDDYAANTSLFITPAQPGDKPFEFRFTDALMTNFHLPRSTLLALVAALPQVGVDRLKQWYALAIEQHYRFYSFGDAMLIM